MSFSKQTKMRSRETKSKYNIGGEIARSSTRRMMTRSCSRSFSCGHAEENFNRNHEAPSSALVQRGQMHPSPDKASFLGTALACDICTRFGHSRKDKPVTDALTPTSKISKYLTQLVLDPCDFQLTPSGNSSHGRSPFLPSGGKSPTPSRRMKSPRLCQKSPMHFHQKKSEKRRRRRNFHEKLVIPVRVCPQETALNFRANVVYPITGDAWSPVRTRRNYPVQLSSNTSSDLFAWKISHDLFVFTFETPESRFYVRCPESGTGLLRLTDEGNDPTSISDPTRDYRVFRLIYSSLTGTSYLQPAFDPSLWIDFNERGYAIASKTTERFARPWSVASH